MGNAFRYLNLREKTCFSDIDAIFPGWGDRERLAVFSPHDDDALIGAGYAMAAAFANGAEVYVFIFCSGDCGYSSPEEKDIIVNVRKRETLAAYSVFGIPEERVVRLDFPDFSAWQFLGYKMRDGSEGAFIRIVSLIRKLGITRVMVPNGYREHIDHEAVYKMGAYDAVQAGDPILADFGAPQKVKSLLQYSVWADFPPEDALVAGLGDVRANRAILVPSDIECKVAAGLEEFTSQGRIINDLVQARAERKTPGGYLELYLSFDPRPRLDFKPYVRLAGEIIR